MGIILNAAWGQRNLTYDPEIAVLSVLDFPENIMHNVLAQMGEHFICRCGDPRFQNPLTFPELVR